MKTLSLAIVLASFGAAAQEPQETAQFIERSVVTFPKFHSAYTLIDSHYDPEQWTYGVTTNWSVQGAPAELRVSVFAYPVGRASAGEAVEQLMSDMELSMREAVTQGMYSNVTADGRTRFIVDAPARAGGAEKSPDRVAREPEKHDAGTPDAERSPKRDDKDKEIAERLAAAFAETAPTKTNTGLRQSFKMTREDQQWHSIAYIFYRQLFAFKVRVSAPESSMDRETFEALSDTAARHLVPRFSAENFGSCANRASVPRISAVAQMS